MGDIEHVLLLLLAAVLLVRIAEFGRIPAPIVLVLGGLAIALVPGLPEFELDPDVIFLIFIPPLVHAAGWSASVHELRAVRKPLALMAFALVFLSAAVVAVVAHTLVPGMGWATAAVLGAVLAPTDTVAAISIFRRLGAPERVRLLVEGESMLNDATALVLYGIAVGVATGDAFSLGGASLDFVTVSAGGLLVGLAFGWLSTVVVRRQTDAALVTVLTVLTAYGAYIGAEELHVSGILAAVVAGASIAARMAFVFAMGASAGETRGQRFAVGWSGMKGAISMAAALAVPLSVDARPQIVFLSFALILLTLVGQGLTLPLVIRALGLEQPRRWSDEEAVARMEAAQAALDRLDEIEEEGLAEEAQLGRLRDLYRARFRMCAAVLGGEDPETAVRQERLADYGRLRRELIGVERHELLALRDGGRLRDATLRQIERDLDLEEARIRS